MVKKKEKKPKEETKTDQELKEPVLGNLVANKVHITKDFENGLVLYDKGAFGEVHGVKKKRLELSLIEALYLIDREKLIVKDGRGKVIGFDAFVNKAKKLEANFWTRFRVYRDFRTRGYILKTALKFGADFRVYRRGIKPGEDHAKWVLFCASENDSLTWRQFAAMNRVAHSTRKNLLVGVVDDEGDVTYYEIRWKKP